MQASDQCDKIARALAKAQGSIARAEKDGENPHFRYRYSSLGSIWDACRVPLSENDLAVVQNYEVIPTGIKLTTELAHASGQWYRQETTWPCNIAEPTKLGGGITYARKYALASMCGVAPEDDQDGAIRANQGQPEATPAQLDEISTSAAAIGQTEQVDVGAVGPP